MLCRVKRDKDKCNEIQSHKLKVFFDKDHDPLSCEECVLYALLYPIESLEPASQAIVDEWVQKYKSKIT